MSELPPNWWRDRKLLESECAKYESLRACGQAHGLASSTLSTWRGNLGLPKLTPGGKPGSGLASVVRDEAEASLLQALKRLGDSATVHELADAVDCSPKRIHEMAEHLRESGYRLKLPTDEEPKVVLHRVARPSSREHNVLFRGKVYRFGIISDVHLNSKHCRVEELHIAYDRLAAEGIDTVYNAGDIVAGRGIYRGQDHELLHHTYEDQVAYAVE